MYGAEISRRNPGCIIFLLDQSKSMSWKFAGTRVSKAAVCVDAIERHLRNLILTCTTGDSPDGAPHHKFDVAVLGYSKGSVGSAFRGTLSELSDVVSIVDVYRHPFRIEERKQNIFGKESPLVKRPVWFTPRAEGTTNTVGAMTRVRGLVQEWAAKHPDSFPPIVIHVTDGGSQDGDPTGVAREIRAITTRDGNVLLFNIHISEKRGTPIIFPSSTRGLSAIHSRQLFEMSSELPPSMFQFARHLGLDVGPGARGMAFNAHGENLLMLFDIGTRIAPLR